MRSTPRCLAVTACLLLALALSGIAAGANQNATPKKWVATLCGSFVTWEHTVKTELIQLKTTVDKLKKSGDVSPAAAKAELVRFLGRIVGATNTLIHGLEAVGPPSTKNGDKLQKALLVGLGQVRKAFKQARKAAQNMPTASRQEFAQAAQRLAAKVAAGAGLGNGALSGLAQYDTKKLDQAFRQTPACRRLIH